MYIRLDGFSKAPQGEVFFLAAMGKRGEPMLASLAADIDDVATAIQVTDVTGTVAPVGVFKIGNETIRYGRYDIATSTFSLCVRGYDDTLAEAHEAGDSADMISVVYAFDTSSPSFSLWNETDHLLQFMAGCTVDELRVPIQNEDAVLVTFKGRGMRMGWAGSSNVTLAALEGDTEVRVEQPGRFSIGARVQNKTLGDWGANGYEILEINYSSNTLTFGEGIGQGWSVGDEITGYMPKALISGEAVESRDTVIAMGGVYGKIKKTELTIGVPKTYLDVEVGTIYPEEYVSTVRAINCGADCVLRRQALDKFREGYDDVETDWVVTFGRRPGKKVSFAMPRVKPTVPSVQFDGPAVGLQISASALGNVSGGQVGENSLYIVFE
jgi:hypothetical protein